MYYLILLALVLSSCTYSLNFIHSEGTASDLVDETQATSPTVSPTVNLTNGPTSPVHEQPRGLNGPMQSIS